MQDKNWIVITGHPVDTAGGGGFEFFGPFTEEQAQTVRVEILKRRDPPPGDSIVLAVELLGFYNRTLFGEP